MGFEFRLENWLGVCNRGQEEWIPEATRAEETEIWTEEEDQKEREGVLMCSRSEKKEKPGYGGT